MRERQGEREMKLWICNLHSSNLSVEKERERERDWRAEKEKKLGICNFHSCNSECCK
jgi:hypothetical protein